MSEARLVELKNPVHLRIRNKGLKIYYIGDLSQIEDDFDIDLPTDRFGNQDQSYIEDFVKIRNDFDSVERITPQQFKKEYTKALEAGEHVVLI